MNSLSDLPGITPGETNISKVLQSLKESIAYLASSQLQKDVFALKLAFISISILFFVVIIYFLKKDGYLNDAYFDAMRELSEFKDYGLKKWQKRWRKIKKHLEKEAETYSKLALLEAHKFFDDVLKRMGYPGENLEERLRQLTEKDVSNLKEVFEVYQVCQDIARDPDYKLAKESAKKLLNVFEKALTELQAL